MVNLSASGGSITFEFSGNSGYLQEGVITCPVNSLSLILESDSATFRKSASNDIFVSARYEDFGMSKAELETWFKNNAVGSTGGGGDITSGEVQTMIDESISGKADTSAVTEAISAATDDMATKTWVGEQGYLTEHQSLSAYSTTEEVNSAITEAVSGKADTSAVTASINAAVSGKVDTTDFNTYSAATDERITEDEEVTASALNALNSALSGKASQSDLETVSGQVANKQDTLVSGTNIKTINNESLLGSGNIDIQGGVSESVYTAYTAATDAVLSGKVNTTTYTAYTAATDAVLSGKQDTLISGTSIKTINNGSILGSGNIDLVTQSEFKTLSNDVYIISYGNSSTYSSAFVGSKTAYGFTVDLTSYSAAYQKWPFRVYDTVNPNFYNIQISAFGQFFDGSGNQINMPSYLDPNLTKCVNKIFSVYFNTNAYYADYFPNTGNRTFTIYESFIKKSVKDALSGKVDTSAITSAVTSASTDSEIPTAKAVYDATQSGGGVSESAFTAYTAATDERITEDEEVTASALNTLNSALGGFKLQQISQADYDALVSGGTVDNSTLYIITNVVS